MIKGEESENEKENSQNIDESHAAIEMAKGGKRKLTKFNRTAKRKMSRIKMKRGTRKFTKVNQSSANTSMINSK
jgi:hypothetical protein